MIRLSLRECFLLTAIAALLTPMAITVVRKLWPVPYVILDGNFVSPLVLEACRIAQFLDGICSGSRYDERILITKD